MTLKVCNMCAICIIVTYVGDIIVIYRLPKGTVIMPGPHARALSMLKSIILSQGQSINHDNPLCISNYYFYFIEGNKTF